MGPKPIPGRVPRDDEDEAEAAKPAMLMEGRKGGRAVEFFPASANGAKNIIKATAECHSNDWPKCPPRLPRFRDLLYVQFTVLKRENPVYKMGKYYDFI